jgi:hypothetical protein
MWVGKHSSAVQPQLPPSCRSEPAALRPSHLMQPSSLAGCPACPSAAYISACAGIVLLLSALLQPFMPSFTAKLLAQLGVAEVRRRAACSAFLAACAVRAAAGPEGPGSRRGPAGRPCTCACCWHTVDRAAL